MAFCYRGRCYMHMQEYKRALYDFSAAIRAEAKEQKDYSKNNLAWYYQFSGQCNLLLGQYEEALIHFDIGLSKNETKPLYFYRGITNVSLQRFQEALNDFQSAHNIKDDVDKEKSEKGITYKILYNWGITLRRVGNDESSSQDNLQKSIEYLSLATQARPNEPAAHNNLGLSYFEKELYHDANKSFDRAIQLESTATAADPSLSKENLSFYFNNKGLALYQAAILIGDSLYECIKEYDEAIKLNEGNAENYFNRGNARL